MNSAIIDDFHSNGAIGPGTTLFELYDRVYDYAGILGQVHRDPKEAAFFAGLVPDAADNPLEILDVGCAEGTLSIELARKGHHVTAIDISQGYLERTREAAGAQGVAVRIRLADIEADAPIFEDAAFDVVYLMDVLEHFRSPTAALSNIRTVVKRNGILFINTPNVLCFRKIIRCLVKRNSLLDFFTFDNLHDFHLQTYDYAQLEKTLNFIGFKVEKVIPNQATLPRLSRIALLCPLFRLISRLFPMLSDDLLVQCRKTAPINIKKMVEVRAKHYRGVTIRSL